MSLLGVLMSLALVVSTSAICCIPEKYTAWIRGATFMSGSLYTSEGVQYYDAKHKQIATMTKTTMDDGSISISKVYYNLKTGEVFTLIGESCTRIVTPTPGINLDKPNCFPANSTVSKSLFIGGPHEDLEMQQINIPVKNTVLHMTVTKNHCLPVHHYMRIGATKTTFVSDASYLNFVPAVDDPHVFVLPEACLNATSVLW